ncbi:MAG: PIN domain-containing protein [Terriglobia bacterium]
MVIVDTSVWIEFFDRNNPSVRGDLETLLRQEEVATAGMVLAELRRGCRSAPQVRGLLQAMEPLVYLEADRNSWLRAGELVAECSARGFQVGIADCLLAALAMRESASIFTLDRDFERIPRLRLFRRQSP